MPMRFIARVVAVVVFVIAALASTNTCTPAQQAVETKVEQTILADLAAGKNLAQIETDVATLLAGQPGADAVIVVNDVLAMLIDLGVIPHGLLPQAKAMLEQSRMNAAAHRK
jgi:hypothetical protein